MLEITCVFNKNHREIGYEVQAFVLLSLSICTILGELTYAGGFSAETLVHKKNQLVSIESLEVHDYVVSYNCEKKYQSLFYLYQIIKKHLFVVDSYIEVEIENIKIFVSSNQQFYSITCNDWVVACNLECNDSLLCFDGSTVRVKSVTHINQPIILYNLSIDQSHTFCVSPYAVVVHNCEPVTIIATGATVIASIACPVIAPAIIGVKMFMAVLVGGVGLYMGYKKYQNKKKTFSEIVEEAKKNSNGNSNKRSRRAKR